MWHGPERSNGTVGRSGQRVFKRSRGEREHRSAAFLIAAAVGAIVRGGPVERSVLVDQCRYGISLVRAALEFVKCRLGAGRRIDFEDRAATMIADAAARYAAVFCGSVQHAVHFDEPCLRTGPVQTTLKAVKHGYAAALRIDREDLAGAMLATAAGRRAVKQAVVIDEPRQRIRAVGPAESVQDGFRARHSVNL